MPGLGSHKSGLPLFSNPKVSEADILSGHLGSTRDRVARTSGPVLVLHDTTEFSYKRDDIDAIGITHEVSSRRTLDGRVPKRVVCGVLMHSSLAVTTEGLPLGIAAIKFWTRKKFKGAQALQRKVNPTRVPIEQKESLRWLQNLQQSTALLNVPERCVHIGDRESDIYELFCAARDAGTHFLFRTCVDRVAGDGTHTIAHEMKEVRCKGLHHLKVQDKKGNSRHAVLELRYRRLRVLPPVGKRQRYPALTLTVIHAHERNPASGCDSIDWKLITDLPVRSRADAIEKLQWYALRWKIEVFHKILKSGCRAEDSKLRTAQRLVNLIAMFCLLSWRIFWLTMINRSAPEASPRLAFTELELKLLDHFMAGCDKRFHRRRKLGDYLVCLARLGGYLARTSDPPPGNMVIWRGLSRLTDISLGATIEARIVGN